MKSFTVTLRGQRKDLWRLTQLVAAAHAEAATAAAQRSLRGLLEQLQDQVRRPVGVRSDSAAPPERQAQLLFRDLRKELQRLHIEVRWVDTCIDMYEAGGHRVSPAHLLPQTKNIDVVR